MSPCFIQPTWPHPGPLGEKESKMKPQRHVVGRGHAHQPKPVGGVCGGPRKVSSAVDLKLLPKDV